MLPLREVKILRLLSQQDFSGDELAKQLNASREQSSETLPRLMMKFKLIVLVELQRRINII